MAFGGFPAGSDRSALRLQNTGWPLRHCGVSAPKADARFPWGLDALEDSPGPRPSLDRVWGQRRDLPPPSSSCGPVTL